MKGLNYYAFPIIRQHDAMTGSVIPEVMAYEE
jgi:hypothetical protein